MGTFVLVQRVVGGHCNEDVSGACVWGGCIARARAALSVRIGNFVLVKLYACCASAKKEKNEPRTET
jgi:hypothetical protein